MYKEKKERDQIVIKIYDLILRLADKKIRKTIYLVVNKKQKPLEAFNKDQVFCGSYNGMLAERGRKRRNLRLLYFFYL